MKTKIIFPLIFLFGNFLIAQIKTPSQPEEGYYEMVKSMAKPAFMGEKELLASKPNSLPDNFLDSLKKYDWFEIGSYYHYEKKFSSSFKLLDSAEIKYANIQLNFKRYTESGVVYEMFVDRRKNGDFGIYTTTFDTSTATQLRGIENIKGQAYMVTENYGEKEKQKILSYANGVMIMEISQNPFGVTDKKFRIAYLAVPRMF